MHIHIEEAELSLDPEAQRALISNLIDEAFHKNNEDRKLGLMIATHSPLYRKPSECTAACRIF